MTDTSHIVTEIKTSVELLSLLNENRQFFWKENEQMEIKVDLHSWKDYAFYEFKDLPRHGICPIEDLWGFIKVNELN
ncbi:hypothetical protein [Bacillus sp. FJAT-42315]|uniref:hypothetical protein n=1 Tax=Bacillus sp. FJAT-42315 TaxID=2014077 RepID=UPI000BA9C14D|nr:hypothetical protein [Bacillus sp. FJAT-42315]PAQ13452.1 hypothetical protein CD798_15290 [Bacillaceae bacterium SAOS 7]